MFTSVLPKIFSPVIFRSDKYFAYCDRAAHSDERGFMQYQLLLSDLNKNWDVSTNFSSTPIKVHEYSSVPVA